MSDLTTRSQAILPDLINLRHDLHRHPELAYEEKRTAARIQEMLKTLPNMRIQSGMAGGTGIVATLNPDKDGPCVLLRTEMDALPIEELSELRYKSTVEGKMHACGHDGHITCLLGAARLLSQMADDLPGKVKFCFQPAEEDGAGGQRIIEDGALDDPLVDAAFALHGWPDLEIGHVLATAGPMLAASTPFDIEFIGRGGHAAYPHKSSDVVTAAAQFITNAQAVRTRFVDPLRPLVISFCNIETGHTHNVIPERCHVKGTIRSLDDQAHHAARHLLQKFLQSIASSFEIQAELRFIEDYPVLNNDPACAKLVAEAAAEILGKDNVQTQSPPSLGGEDFAFYAQRVPSAMYRVGIRPKDSFDFPALHNPRFNFSDEAIPVGVQLNSDIDWPTIPVPRRRS